MRIRVATSAVVFVMMANICFRADVVASFLGKASLVLVLSSCSWHLGVMCARFILRRRGRISGHGKTVLITGCDSGFGNLNALRLNALGFTVYAGCMDTASEGAVFLKEASVHPRNMYIVKLDITNDRDVADVFDLVSEKIQGELYGLINNSGIGINAPVEWGSLDSHFRRVFEVNTLGHIRVIRKFLPLIKKARGRIVNMSSMSGRYSAIGVAAYSLSKAALIAFGDSLRLEMQFFGVKVIEIEPGLYKTQMTSTRHSLDELTKMWSETDSRVKSAVGEKFYVIWRNKLKQVMDSSLISPKVNDVINAVEDALCSYEPSLVYRCLPSVSQRLYFWLIIYVLPREMSAFLCPDNLKRVFKRVRK